MFNTVKQHTLELRDVVALLSSDSRSESSTGVDMPSKISIDLLAHFWKHSEIVVGWIPASHENAMLLYKAGMRVRF